VVVLERGHVLATGSPREIQSNTQVRAAYLG
jgi:ABC-type branched-subunit amino acid transport system ATPase component